MDSLHSFWQDPDYYRGTVSIRQTEHGSVPQRFTDRQMSHLGKDGRYTQRSLCTAGCSLTMLTNAKWLELELVIDHHARDYACVQMVVDGSWSSRQEAAPLGETPRSVRMRFELPPITQTGSENLRQVELFLPTYAETAIVRVTMDADAIVKPAPRPAGPRLLAIGDSITQGADARNPACSYPVQFARLLDGELLNQGVGGHIFDPDILDPKLAYEADVITVAYGINDWYQEYSLEQIADNARQLLDRIQDRYPGKPIIVISPLWSFYEEERKTAGTVADVRQKLAAVAGSLDGVYCIDGSLLVPHQLSLFADGLHPTDEGYGHYASGLYRFWIEQNA